MIKTLQATVDAANKREETLIQERDHLKDEINLLRKKLFGTSSEKHPVDFPGQFNLLMKQNWNRILQLPKQKNWQPHFRQKHLEKEKTEQRMPSVSKGSR